jgi:ribonuclease T2
MGFKRLSLLIVLASLMSPAAFAAPACSIPRGLRPFPAHAPPPEEIQAGVVIAYHLLAINWTPEWRRTEGKGSTAQRLDMGRNDFGFTLHGLWPNGVRPPYPRYCTPVGGIDRATVRRMYCRTPSAELLQHEWAAHGACGWTDPKAYFAQASRLYDRLVMPKIESIPPATLTAGAVRRAFVASNRWLKPETIYIQLDKGERLTEVRLCYDLAFKPMACMSGVGASDETPIRLTPSATRAF